MRFVFSCLITLFTFQSAWALDVQKVTDGVYALVGEKKQRSLSNLANNATFGVVVTQDGLVLMDPGGSWKGAQQIHKTIQTFTDQPIKVVINTGGQDHRWLGNGYWKKQGAQIIASQAAVDDQQERSSNQLSALRNFLGKGLEGTEPVYADTVFEDTYTFRLGTVSFDIRHIGAAHTPGDAFVWVKDKNTLFSGDIVYLERLLGIGSQSNSKEWLDAFDAIATINPKHLVPGHGQNATMKEANAQTYQYLLNIRNKMREHIDNGGDEISAPKIDQSAFKHLEQFDALAGRNAQQVFTEMEWE